MTIVGHFSVQHGSAGYHWTYNGLRDGITVTDLGMVTTDAGTTFGGDAWHVNPYFMSVNFATGEVQVSNSVATFTEHAIAADPSAPPAIIWGEFVGAPGESQWTEFWNDVHAPTACPLT
jgi:hypothetical protein